MRSQVLYKLVCVSLHLQFFLTCLKIIHRILFSILLSWHMRMIPSFNKNVTKCLWNLCMSINKSNMKILWKYWLKSLLNFILYFFTIMGQKPSLFNCYLMRLEICYGIKDWYIVHCGQHTLKDLHKHVEGIPNLSKTKFKD